MGSQRLVYRLGCGRNAMGWGTACTMTRAQNNSVRVKEQVELETPNEFVGSPGNKGLGSRLSHTVKPSSITWKLRLLPGKQGAGKGSGLPRQQSLKENRPWRQERPMTWGPGGRAQGEGRHC